MIKKTTETKEVVVNKRFCDDCGKELHWGLQCCVAQCEICKKDLCNDCIGYEEETGGDYRIVWCKKCWEIGKPYRTELEILQNKIEEARKMWEARCKND